MKHRQICLAGTNKPLNNIFASCMTNAKLRERDSKVNNLSNTGENRFCQSLQEKMNKRKIDNMSITEG